MNISKRQAASQQAQDGHLGMLAGHQRRAKEPAFAVSSAAVQPFGAASSLMQSLPWALKSS